MALLRQIQDLLRKNDMKADSTELSGLSQAFPTEELISWWSGVKRICSKRAAAEGLS